MERPKKKEIKTIFDSHPANSGYNQACDDWEKYHEACREQWLRALEISHFTCIELPSEEEMIDLVNSVCNSIVPSLTFNEFKIEVAKAISKRIRGEK